MLVVATWNLENLFRPAVDPSGPTNQAAYEAKLDALAGTITLSGAHVVGLQEVGTDEALSDLTARLPGTWSRVLSSAPDGRGIAVAFIARIPMTDGRDVVDLPELLAGGRVTDAGATLTRLGRGLLGVTVTDPGTGVAVRLLNCHLKSKLLTYPGNRFSPLDEGERARFSVYALNRRAAEAGAVRIHANEVLDGQGRERAVILLGDLNDTVDAATTQLMLGPGGSEIGTLGALRPDAGDANRLWNLAPLIPEDQRFSRVYRGHGELIDHMLVSRALLEKVTEVRTRLAAPAVDAGTELPSVTEDPTERRDEPGSDHSPVVATFDLG